MVYLSKLDRIILLTAHVLLEIDYDHGHANADVIVECYAEKYVYQQFAEVHLAPLLEYDACIDEWKVSLVLTDEIEFGIEHACVHDALLQDLVFRIV